MAETRRRDSAVYEMTSAEGADNDISMTEEEVRVMAGSNYMISLSFVMIALSDWAIIMP